MYKIQVKNLPKSICGIYKITFPNGKVYIGQSKDIKRRIQHHNVPNNIETLVDKKINQYGKIIEVEILEECSEDLLNEKEKYWIQFYNSHISKNGYNISLGGNSAKVPSKFSKEQGLEIANLILYNKTIRFEEIAKKYNCHINTIKKINKGESPYHYKEFSYPIRTKEESRVLRAFIGEEKIKQILFDLRNTTHSMKNIGLKYGYCRNTISDINKGKKEPLNNYDYPARKTK